MSSSYVNVGDGGPEAVMNVALRVKTAGDDVAETALSLKQAIEAIEQEQPWGQSDEYATAFKKNYMAVPDGSKLPANDAVKQSLGDSGQSLSQLGGNVIETMAKYGATDGEGSDSIGSVAASAHMETRVTAKKVS